MTFSIKRSFAVTIALLVPLIICRADVPNGPIAFSFGSNNAPVYDLTGSFQMNQTMIGAGQTEVGLSYGIDVTQDSNGFLTGAGTTLLVVGNDFVAAEYTAKGKITRSGADTRLTLSVRLIGEDVIGGVSTPFNISVVYKFTVMPQSGTLEGTARGNARFARLGNSRIRSDVSAALPANADGAWTLQMNIVPLNRLAGTAFVVLSNGRTLQLNLTGSYSAARDRAVIRMSGFDATRGNSITVILGPESRLRGRVLGQVVRCDACL
jgi:hypothetical protein